MTQTLTYRMRRSWVVFQICYGRCVSCPTRTTSNFYHVIFTQRESVYKGQVENKTKQTFVVPVYPMFAFVVVGAYWLQVASVAQHQQWYILRRPTLTRVTLILQVAQSTRKLCWFVFLDRCTPAA